MTTILMDIASESMTIKFSELSDNSIKVYSFLSTVHSNHNIILTEREIRELRKFLTIQLRKLKPKNNKA